MSPQARTGTAKADDDEDEKVEATSSGDDAEGVTEPDGSNAHGIPLPTDIQAPIEPVGGTTFMTAEEAEKAKDDEDED